MTEKSRSAVSSDEDLQVIRGSKLSSTSSDYIVQDLIAESAFAKVAKCVKSVTNETVAVRITKKHSASKSEKEDSILQKLKIFNPEICNFVRWNSSFIYKAHLCEEFELLDMNLKEFVNMRQTSSLLLKEIRPILHQMATALQVLKNLGIAHTDLKPENIMLVDHERQPLRVKLIDFGSACDASKAEQGSYIQSRWYRAPETILGLPCNEAIDMWSLGCIAAELFLGSPLYPGSCEYEMIWYITQTQGQLPGYFLNAGLKTSQFYRKTWPNLWKLKTPHEYARIPWIDCMFSSLNDLKEIQQTPDSHLSEADAKAAKADLENFVDLVKQMLQMDPTQRITPSQVLQHPFITMSHLSSDQGASTQQPPLDNQASASSSCGAQSPQNPLSEEAKSSMTHIKPLENRERAYAQILQNASRSPDGTFPKRKTRKIHKGRSPVKRPYSEISKGCKRIPEVSSPERKRRRMTMDSEEKDTELQVLGRSDSTSPVGNKTKICSSRALAKRPYSAISQGSKRTPSPERKRRRMTMDTEEKVTEIQVLGSPDNTSPVWKMANRFCGRALAKRPYSEISQGCKRTPSPERKRRRVTIDTEEKDPELPSTSQKAPSIMIHLKSVEMKEKVSRSQNDTRTSGSTSSGKKKRKEDRRETKTATKIWIIGSSYIKRGEEAAYKQFGENFGLNAKVEWFGKGGMRWGGVLPRFYAELSTQSPPDILVIHAGGNDLGLMSAKELASIMKKDLTQLHAEFPSMKITYSCINERQAWRHGRPGKINKDRKTVNTCMRKAVGNFDGVVIEHPLLRYFDKKIYLTDGVHFTNKGNEIFVTSICCVLKKILYLS